MVTQAEQAAAAVAAVRAVLADPDSLSLASRQEVVDLLAQIAELSHVVDALRVRLAGEIAERSTGPDDQSICTLLGHRKPKEAVASAFGIRSGEAAALLSMARATRRGVSLTGGDIAVKYPRVAVALGDGDVSLSQARAIVGTLEPAAPRADLAQLAWAEGALVDAALDPASPLVPELLVTQARAYVAVLDPDGVLPNAERQRAQRDFRIWQRPDGVWKWQGTSPPEDGSDLKAVVDAFQSPRARVSFRDDDPACNSDAGDGPRTDEQPATDDSGVVDDRTPGQKRHDIVISIVRAQAAAGETPRAGGEVPRLVFTGTIEAFDAYREGVEHRDRTLTIEHTGSVVPIETVDRLLCESVVKRAVVDGDGQVLELGRTQRTFTQAQRRALAAQYGGCATPDCRLPAAWTEAHHVHWWRNGGCTDLKNGILLCSNCHHEVHAGRLLVVGTPGHWRVVPQLRPADRYARTSRAPVTAAATAAAPLAVKLPDTAALLPSSTVEPAFRDISHPAERRLEASGSPSAPIERQVESAGVPSQFTVRRTRRKPGSIEARLRRRLPAGARSRCRSPAIDFRSPPPIVMRT